MVRRRGARRARRSRSSRKISKALEAALATRGRPAEARRGRLRGQERAAAAFADIIKADVALWAKVVKEAGITAD